MPAAIHCKECGNRIVRDNQRALAKTIQALTLSEEDAALIQHAKSLASLLDGFPYEVKLHSEYREVLKRLMEAGAGEEADAFAELLAELRGNDPAPADAPADAPTPKK